MSLTVLFNKVGLDSLALVGGKNASLGEMIQHLKHAGVRVPEGFAVTAQAYKTFLQENGLNEKIYSLLEDLNVEKVVDLKRVGKKIRGAIIQATFSATLQREVKAAVKAISKGKRLRFAIRSSATSEDLPEASFAGLQETYLHVQGNTEILAAIKKVYASLFTDRAIAYRVHHKFPHHKVAMSVGIQRMVGSDEAVSGVMFSMDTESGFDQVVLINASYGLGEAIVAGKVNPDEFIVYKPNILTKKPAILKRGLGEKNKKIIFDNASLGLKIIEVPKVQQLQYCLNDSEVQTLARLAIKIEQHYGRAMDIEWAKDATDGRIYILQARPETVKSREQGQIIEHYKLLKKSKVIVTGRSVGQRIGKGQACILASAKEMSKMAAGDVLVTDMTDPDWEPIMKNASAIITNRGGRTCHAAIVARELGIPAIVGCNDATRLIKPRQNLTVSCAEGDEGAVYDGLLDFKVVRKSIKKLPHIPVDISLNLGNPEQAFTYRNLPVNGVGLARLEFIISQMIGVHPNAVLNFKNLPNELKIQIQEKTAAYQSPLAFYTQRLQEGIAVIAAAFYPRPVIIRFSDFKSNEYANLLGGEAYETLEENPMLGFRGASRYTDQRFKAAFKLECKVISAVREVMGFDNVHVMVPFTRTVNEARDVTKLAAEYGIKRRKNGLKFYMMCEVPSNALLAEKFLKYFDGYSIGSNDLTQLTLGLDRDSDTMAHLFDERDEAVKALLHLAITACRKQGKYIGICGQGPSDHPDFAKWLMQEGIESISLNPDSVIETWAYLAKHK